MSESDDENDKTPIFLHPTRRSVLLKQGQYLFNDEKFFEAHEAWEELWHIESGRDRLFVQGLIQVAGHLVHVQKKNWSGARSLATAAREKLRTPASHRLYRELDLIPIIAALEYNLGLLAQQDSGLNSTPQPEAFLFPKLFN